MSTQLATYKTVDSVLDKAKDWKTDSDGILVKDETVEMSVFGGKTLTVNDTLSGVAELNAMFPSKSMSVIIGCLTQMAMEDGWSKERFNYAVNKMKRHPYPTFTAGQFLEIDKKVTLGKNVEALRRKVRFALDYKDIVMVAIHGKDGMIRAYAYKDEAEDVLPQRILAFWDDDRNEWKYTGLTLDDKKTKERQDWFKKVLYKYCKLPPRFNGEYAPEVVKDFFEKFGAIVPPGDQLKYETIPGFYIDTYLAKFNLMYQNNYKVE